MTWDLSLVGTKKCWLALCLSLCACAICVLTTEVIRVWYRLGTRFSSPLPSWIFKGRIFFIFLRLTFCAFLLLGNTKIYPKNFWNYEPNLNCFRNFSMDISVCPCTIIQSTSSLVLLHNHSFTNLQLLDNSMLVSRKHRRSTWAIKT